jgi:hypothetical protein
MDKELMDTREELDRLTLKWKRMKQGEKGSWRYNFITIPNPRDD